ncbi:hypothetical protein OXB_0565 [Bacillus sp. OxB-1]|uniref:hypothetical protein n=1 Tax=Bacillus sp. (strain OxB-1) TaxID=98228 RepID=UPI0005822689|nr:hypothetical protein [Bacillus sp. OxB-1]BAQ09037.1 hypothetical protein OXB_0565 [Bacillus sp. OxB-1]
MKGQHLVIGLVIFVLLVVALLYFAMTSTFKKDENGWQPAIEMEENIKAHADLR